MDSSFTPKQPSWRKQLGALWVTINAMAVDASRGFLYDPFGGLKDSEAPDPLCEGMGYSRKSCK